MNEHLVPYVPRAEVFVDMPLPQLRAYLPERAEPADFDGFWRLLAASGGARSYKRYAGEKDIRIYPYDGHEGGGPAPVVERVTRAKKALG
ncbi:hypothetical protein FAF44_32805 [Nonomuraea sp. MG754425]|uniref:acetylxylan esterase n=1 Tax=Nonomuraea sp. MG754425 TaxID=2570319 RepID=UPI0023512AC3|nr:acetylxylan esterase [Nonomuraea sp. MG754425]MCF6473136.1 hypothetical protein [Nonomuraea sp. MG754425]